MGLKAVGSSTSAAAPPSSFQFPVGYVYMSIDPTDPATVLGYGTWTALPAGKMLATFDTSDANFNTVLSTGGNALSVSVGSMNAPVFSGDAISVNTSQVSAGTPAGNVSAPTFSGNAVTGNTSSVTAGTPTGNVSKPTFTGDALANHNHELPMIIQSNVVVRVLAQSVFGSGTSRASAGNFNTAASTTAGNVALSGNRSAGTPTGNISTPTFTGDALAGHNHNVTITATGTVSAPTFTGSALAAHNHNLTVTATGNVTAPTFTGNPQVVLNPYVVLYAWRRAA